MKIAVNGLSLIYMALVVTNIITGITNNQLGPVVVIAMHQNCRTRVVNHNL